MADNPEYVNLKEMQACGHLYSVWIHIYGETQQRKLNSLSSECYARLYGIDYYIVNSQAIEKALA
jgi:hypothetical protein